MLAGGAGPAARPALGWLQAARAATVVLCFAASTAAAGEWPQILGPHRDGRADNETLAEAWPKDGPKVRWERRVGRGYAGVAVAAGRAILFHRLNDEQIVEALDPQTGKSLWKNSFATRATGGLDSDDGPRCVPLVHRGWVYLHGVDGALYCVHLDTGRLRWSRTAAADFAAPEGYFAVGSTPIVVDDKLLVNVGGRGAGLVAFSLAEGKTLWKATDEIASYASPTAVTVGGERHVLFLTRLNLVSIDPATGRVRFSYPFGKRGPTVNAATPISCDGRVFLSASYGIGAAMLRLDRGEPALLWKSHEAISSQYSTSVYHDGFLYGIDGRSDDGLPCALRAVDAATGKVAWSDESFRVGHLILADAKLVILREDGSLLLARPSPKRLEKLALAQVLSGTTRALPALADGLLYVRDADVLKCLEIGRRRD